MAPVTKGRNTGLWNRLLPDVVQWLKENPLASCADAGRRFEVNPVTLASRLEHHYPGQFDFEERRHRRGDLHRPKARKGAKGDIDLRAEFDRIIASLARIESALIQRDIVIQHERLMLPLEEATHGRAVTLSLDSP